MPLISVSVGNLQADDARELGRVASTINPSSPSRGTQTPGEQGNWKTQPENTRVNMDETPRRDYGDKAVIRFDSAALTFAVIKHYEGVNATEGIQ